MKLKDKETLVGAFITNGNTECCVLFASGQLVRYDEKQVPIVGIKAGGVKAGSRAIDAPLVGAVGLPVDSKLNFMVATDKGGLKPVYPRYVNASSRNTQGTSIFKSFKSDHHDAVGIITYADGDDVSLVSNFKSRVIETNKVPYQPVDKIINKFIDLDKMEKLVAIYNNTTPYIDNKIKSFKLEDNKPEIASFDESKVVEDEIAESDEDKKKKEKYKNISIDDLFKM